MLLPEVWGLLRYWGTHPPLHMQTLPFYRHFCGIEAETAGGSQASPGASRATTQDKKTLQAITRGVVKTHDQLPLPVQQMINKAKKQREATHGTR